MNQIHLAHDAGSRLMVHSDRDGCPQERPGNPGRSPVYPGTWQCLSLFLWFCWTVLGFLEFLFTSRSFYLAAIAVVPCSIPFWHMVSRSMPPPVWQNGRPTGGKAGGRSWWFMMQPSTVGDRHCMEPLVDHSLIPYSLESFSKSVEVTKGWFLTS